jgi:hypothetical protein
VELIAVLLDVRPSGYADAAHVLGDTVAECARLAWVGLQTTLDGSSGMAGSDDVGANWGARYDAAATRAGQATEDVCNASYQLAALLEQTGSNYDAAEWASVPGSPARPAQARWRGASIALGSVPTSVGIGLPSPGGWSLLQHAIGYLWPDGHQDLLRSAAYAWERAADQLDALAPDIGRAATQLMLQRAPEVEDAFTVVDAMSSHLSSLAASYRRIGASCDGYAQHLDAAHHGIIEELKSFLEWTAGIEAAGGLFAICTFGLSELGAQLGEAAEVTRAAQAIKAVIETLRTAAAGEQALVEAAGVRVAAVSDTVSPILAKRLEEVRLAAVSQLGAIREGQKLATQTDEAAVAAATPEAAALVELERAATMPGFSSSRAQIEEKFDHAAAFGVALPRGRKGFEAFESTVKEFVQRESTQHKAGTYLGKPVILNYDESTRLVVIQETNGSFVSGWRMSDAQLRHVVRDGRLGGH